MKALLIWRIPGRETSRLHLRTARLCRATGGRDRHAPGRRRESSSPRTAARVYLADAATCGEYNPDLHKQLILAAVAEGKPRLHRLPPLLLRLGPGSAGGGAPAGSAQVSEIIGIDRRRLRGRLLQRQDAADRQAGHRQGGAHHPGRGFHSPGRAGRDARSVEKLEVAGSGSVEFVGYEPAEAKGVDLAKAEVIVSAGRGIGKKDNVPVIAALAKALGGELGASRPVVDAGWVEHSHQVGTTGQTVSPEALRGLRHQRRHPAPGGDEEVGFHRRHQQGQGCTDRRGGRRAGRRRCHAVRAGADGKTAEIAA